MPPDWISSLLYVMSFPGNRLYFYWIGFSTKGAKSAISDNILILNVLASPVAFFFSKYTSALAPKASYMAVMLNLTDIIDGFSSSQRYLSNFPMHNQSIALALT